MTTARPRRLAVRLLTAALATLVSLALVEVALEFLGQRAVARLLATRAHGGADADAPTILCVGDSYTFGLYYRPEESYPGRLEEILRAGESGGGARWSVVNGGIPAQNLAQVADRLPEQLARLQPKAVVILGGFNDRWNFAGAREQGAVARFFERLVLVKLARLVFADVPDERTRIGKVSATEIAVENGDGGAAIDIDKTGEILAAPVHEARVTARLEAIVALVRGAGALPLLCSYPSPERIYEPPSRAAAAVAQRMGVPFVDLRAALATELEQHRYDELFIPGDKHPTERGYWRMAVMVARALAAARVWQPNADLGRALAAAPDHAFALPPFAETLYPIALALRDGSAGDGAATVMLHGPPGARFRLLLAGARAPAQKFGRLEIELADDEVFRRELSEPRLEAAFDARGAATLALAPADRDGARFAVLVVFHDLLLAATDMMVRGIAGPLELP